MTGREREGRGFPLGGVLGKKSVWHWPHTSQWTPPGSLSGCCCWTLPAALLFFSERGEREREGRKRDLIWIGDDFSQRRDCWRASVSPLIMFFGRQPIGFFLTFREMPSHKTVITFKLCYFRLSFFIVFGQYVVWSQTLVTRVPFGCFCRTSRQRGHLRRKERKVREPSRRWREKK